MSLTLEEARIALGMRPFEAIENMAREMHIYPRRSGRTTRMLLEAVIASQQGKVQITGRTLSDTKRLVNQARSMCKELGLNPLNIQPAIEPYSNIDTYRVFRDHYMWKQNDIAQLIEDTVCRVALREPNVPVEKKPALVLGIFMQKEGAKQHLKQMLDTLGENYSSLEYTFYDLKTCNQYIRKGNGEIWLTRKGHTPCNEQVWKGDNYLEYMVATGAEFSIEDPLIK